MIMKRKFFSQKNQQNEDSALCSLLINTILLSLVIEHNTKIPVLGIGMKNEQGNCEKELRFPHKNSSNQNMNLHSQKFCESSECISYLNFATKKIEKKFKVSKIPSL